jgi:hypothetical protein
VLACISSNLCTVSIPSFLVAHDKTKDLIHLIQMQNSIDPLQGGLLIQLDGKSSTSTGPRYSPGLVWRRQAVHYIPKFTGALSVLGSLYIIYHLIGTVAGRARLFSSKPPPLRIHSNNSNKKKSDNNTPVIPTFLTTVTPWNNNSSSPHHPAVTTTTTSSLHIKERRLRRIGLDRLLLALSIADVISSTAYIFSHWMLPSEPSVPGVDLGWYDVMFPHSTGTQATCVLQVRQKALQSVLRSTRGNEHRPCEALYPHVFAFLLWHRTLPFTFCGFFSFFFLIS